MTWDNILQITITSLFQWKITSTHNRWKVSSQACALLKDKLQDRQSHPGCWQAVIWSATEDKFCCSETTFKTKIMFGDPGESEYGRLWVEEWPLPPVSCFHKTSTSGPAQDLCPTGIAFIACTDMIPMVVVETLDILSTHQGRLGMVGCLVP